MQAMYKLVVEMCELVFACLCSCTYMSKKRRLIGIGFDGAATFSGDKTVVQRMLKELPPHAMFVHYYCHLHPLVSVLDANVKLGIKHVYTTLMTLFPKTYLAIKGDSESIRSFRAQDHKII